MTTTRINHTGHNHPNTTAARTACRKALATTIEPTYPMIQVGNGKVTHIGVMDTAGGVYGSRCGAGLSRGVRRNSGYGLIKLDARMDEIGCPRCHKTV